MARIDDLRKELQSLKTDLKIKKALGGGKKSWNSIEVKIAEKKREIREEQKNG